MHRLLYRNGLTFEEAKAEIAALKAAAGANEAASAGDVDLMSAFLGACKRGIVR
jgi:UDP-N-acetylglucosamine acyltransferase